MDCDFMTNNSTFYILNNRMDLVEDQSAVTDFLAAYDRETESLRTGDAPECPWCGLCVGSLAWLPPYEVELECWGHRFGDIAKGVGGDWLVSERFKALYEEHGLTGFQGFEPVTVARVIRRNRIRGEPPRYYHVTIVQGRAAIDQEASGFVWKEPPTCPECREGKNLQRYEGIVIEPGTWEGEDLFIPRGLSVDVASSRFKHFCETHDIANAHFIPAEELWDDTYPWNNMEIGQAILHQPVGGPILEKIKTNGEIFRLDTRTNHIVIAVLEDVYRMKEKQLRIKGVFHPRDPWAFWNRH